MIYVFLALLALVMLVTLLLNISVTLKVQYDKETNTFRCTAHYLFITYVITPKEDKKKKKAKSHKASEKPREKDKKKSPLADKLKDRGVGGLLEDIKNIVRGAWGLIVCVLRRSVLKRFSLRLIVVGDDAADTAVLYGYANAVIYPVVSALLDNVKCYKDYDVVITPDFSDDAQADFDFDAVLRLKPVRLIGAVLESREELGKLLTAVKR